MRSLKEATHTLVHVVGVNVRAGRMFKSMGSKDIQCNPEPTKLLFGGHRTTMEGGISIYTVQ